MKRETELLEDSAEELFEEAPCGYLTTRLDGTILRVNRTFETWTGRSREELVERVRFQDLLSPGGRIYHETHYAPLLRMQGWVREVAVEVIRADGSLLPALINSVVRVDDAGEPRVVRTTVFDATDRRRYEQELLRLSKREREMALALQRSLLAGELPRSPGLELEFFYSPGERNTEAGGDWYDAFWLAGGEHVALVVGDVVGRGVAAAATMGQLRSAVRALASTGLGPGELLAALDGFSERHGVGEMTTLVYAQLGLRERSLCFACAGHPPPLVVEAGGDVSLLWEGRCAPLNAAFGVCEWPQASRPFEPGATLLLYTDGLVESPHRPLDAGIQQLREEVAAAARSSAALAELVPSLVRAMQETGQADDVCVLAARLARTDVEAAEDVASVRPDR